jgi:hypothetical protein
MVFRYAQMGHVYRQYKPRPSLIWPRKLVLASMAPVAYLRCTSLEDTFICWHMGL